MPASIIRHSSGRINLHATARAFGVGYSTLRGWYNAGAPLDQPDQMPSWLDRWRAERQRIGKAKARSHWIEANRPLMDAAVELYTRHGLGLKAIRRELALKNTERVRALLIAAGVYRPGGNGPSPEQLARLATKKADEARARLLETRRQCAVCLRAVRAGTGIKTTCRQNGWKFKRIWKYLASRRG